MNGPKRLDSRKFPFNYRVADEGLSIKQKLGCAKVGHVAASEQVRLCDLQCALDALLAKNVGTGRARLSVNYALGLFAVVEDAVSLAGVVAPLLDRCLELLLDCVFSPEMTVIGTQMMHSNATSVTRAPWFEVCKDLQFELGQRLEEQNTETGKKILEHVNSSRNNTLAQLSVAKEVIQTANEQQQRLQLDLSYVRCVTHMMQHLHTGRWHEERRSHMLPPQFKERRLQKHEAVKSFGGSGVSMMNGRWVETNEIFEKMPASRNSEELGNNGDSSILNLNPPPSREALIFATCTTSKDQDHQNCQVKSWKEIRFREVLLSQTDPELSLIQVRNEYFEGLQLLQDLQLQTMIELQNYEAALLQIDSQSKDTTLSALSMPLSHSFSAKIKQLREEESNLRKHLVFIAETYGAAFHVNRIPSDSEIMALAIAKDQSLGRSSKLRVRSGSGLVSPKLEKSWRMYREKGGHDVAYIYRSEEQMSIFMKTIIEDQFNSNLSDFYLPLQEYFYVWLSRAYYDSSAVLSTACSILVALETYGCTCAYAQIAGQALENSEDLLSALRYRYLALIHSLFVTLYNALKTSDSAILLDAQGVLNQWACVAYKGLPDYVARAASDEYYRTVFRLSLNDRVNPHAFSFIIAKMIQQRSDPRIKHMNFCLRSIMHEGEGPFWKALNNSRRALKVDLSSTIIVSWMSLNWRGTSDCFEDERHDLTPCLQAHEEMPSKFTMQELILTIINRANIFEIRPMLDLFIQKTVPFVTVEEFSASALVVARYAIGIDASRFLPQIQTWAFSHLPVGSRPEPMSCAKYEQSFDYEIETISLFVGLALLVKQPDVTKTSSF